MPLSHDDVTRAQVAYMRSFGRNQLRLRLTEQVNACLITVAGVQKVYADVFGGRLVAEPDRARLRGRDREVECV